MTEPTHPDRLSVDDLADFTGVLNDLSAQLEQIAAAERDGGSVELDFSSFAERVGSGADYRIERFADVRLHGSLKHQTASLLVARQHLQDGTFGLCETCGKQIPVGRLEVIPWAATCVGCA